MPVPEYNYPTLYNNLQLEDGQFEVETEPTVSEEDQTSFELSETFSTAEKLGQSPLSARSKPTIGIGRPSMRAGN